MPNYRDVTGSGIANIPNYQDFVECWGYNIVDKMTEGSYQGTFYFVLEKNGKYTVLDISFGSCSLCDFLNGTLNWDEPYIDDSNIEEIRTYFERKRKSIQWYDKDTLIERLKDEELGLTGFWGLDTDKAIEILKEE